MGPAGTDSHPPPGPRAGRFPLLLRHGLQQECDGGVRRAGNDRGGLRLLAYGQAASTGDLVQPVQWSGEMHDEEPALVYYNYRYYNPKDGRWINRDPIAEQGGWNLYGFVGNTPILKTDILGRQFPPGSAGVINNAIKSAAINATRNVGLNQCDAKERVASENCCVIYYCILKQHIYFINNIQGNFICRNCNELKEETLKYGGMYPACDPHFIRETIYIPSIKK